MSGQRATFQGFICAAALLLGLAVDLSHLSWDAGRGILTSANGQMPPDGCSEALIPGRIDGAEFYRCGDGSNYRDINGEYVLVDDSGEPVAGAGSQAGTPDQPVIDNAPTSVPEANPEFKVAPVKN